jgi:plastocyanin
VRGGGRWAGAVLLLGAAVRLAFPALPAMAAARVEILDFGYLPDEFAVPVDEEIVWVNTGAATHTVTADGGAPDDTGSGRIEPGSTFSHVFKEPMTWAYHCDIHRSMKAVLKVVAAPPPTTTATSATTTTTRRPTASTMTRLPGTTAPRTRDTPASDQPAMTTRRPSTARPAPGTAARPPQSTPRPTPTASAPTVGAPRVAPPPTAPAEPLPPPTAPGSAPSVSPPTGMPAETAPAEEPAARRSEASAGQPTAEPGIDRQLALLGAALMTAGASWLVWQTRRGRP